MNRKPDVDWWDAPEQPKLEQPKPEATTSLVSAGKSSIVIRGRDTPTAQEILAEVLPEIAVRFPDWDMSDGTRIKQMLEMMALMIEGALKR